MELEALINSMFPGDEASGLPAFGVLRQSSEFLRDNIDCDNMRKYAKSVNLSEVAQDVNEKLKILKKDKPNVVNHFLASSIEFYFSHPDVVAVLRGGFVTLFPHQRSLPDIDFDLLAPVMQLNARERK